MFDPTGCIHLRRYRADHSNPRWNEEAATDPSDTWRGDDYYHRHLRQHGRLIVCGVWVQDRDCHNSEHASKQQVCQRSPIHLFFGHTLVNTNANIPRNNDSGKCHLHQEWKIQQEYQVAQECISVYDGHGLCFDSMDRRQ